MKKFKWEITAGDHNEIAVIYYEDEIMIKQVKCCDDITLQTKCVEQMISDLRLIFPKSK